MARPSKGPRTQITLRIPNDLDYDLRSLGDWLEENPDTPRYNLTDTMTGAVWYLVNTERALAAEIIRRAIATYYPGGREGAGKLSPEGLR